ncbi:MAG: hypothetical protein Q3997_05655 [Propionibacteriaceae bacterium]|nr:hypothetical protein [Propionibacteriaceae bacterium]
MRSRFWRPARRRPTPPDETGATLTISEYSAYLAEEAPDVLAEFEALATAEQEQYLNLLTNPALYTDEAENLDGVDVSGVSTVQTAAPGGGMMAPLATTVDRSVWSTRWVTILGLKVIEYKVEVGYRVTSGKVTRINNSKAIVLRNLNPLVKTGQTSKSAWVSAGGASARLTASFNYDIGPLKGFSVQIMTLNASLTGSPSGAVSCSWWGE